MQLLLQEQQHTPHAAAAAVVHASAACQDAAYEQPEHAVDSNAGSGRNRIPESPAAAAAEPSRSGATQWRNSDAAGLGAAAAAAAAAASAAGRPSGDALLLLYMRSWFSMLAGLLGIDMLPFYDCAALVKAVA
jgi:hypothetical protein